MFSRSLDIALDGFSRREADGYWVFEQDGKRFEASW